MRVNCSATIMGSNDRKLKAGSSSSKPLSSCVANGQPMCSPAERHLHFNTVSTQLRHFSSFLWLLNSLFYKYDHIISFSLHGYEIYCLHETEQRIQR